ncbi:MAG: pilus assembly PilX N-terminal domain-containing protein [Actinomycetales bacterium]
MRTRNRDFRPDDGAALFFVIGLIVVLSLVALTTGAIASNSFRGATYERAKVTALEAAEAGVDATYVALSAGSLACAAGVAGVPTTAMPAGAPVSATYAVQVQYFDALGAATCADPVTALITSVGTYSGVTGLGPAASRRTMQSLVKLTPTAGNGSGAAIFSGSPLTSDNSLTISSSTAGSGNVYVASGDFNCTNNTPDIAGSLIVAQGGATLTSGCHPTIHGDAWVRDSFSSDKQIDVLGSVLASSGDINLTSSSPSHVWRNARARGAITGSPIIDGIRSAGDQFVAPPWVYGLPAINYSSANWIAAGYTEKGPFAPPSCPSASSLSNSSTPWVVDARSCSLDWTGQTLTLQSNLAVFGNSFQLKNFSVSASGADASKKLYLIVPASVGTTPCSNNIDLSSHTDISPAVTTFLYSPCTVTLANRNTMYGQVYGGSVVESNQFNLTFNSPGVPNVTLFGGDPQAQGQFTVDVVYKRESK